MVSGTKTGTSRAFVRVDGLSEASGS